MNAMQRAFLKSIAPTLEADNDLNDLEWKVGAGVLRKQAADKRKPADKGWDTKLSFKTYSKLNQQGVV